MVRERQTQAQAETAEGLGQARARDTLSQLARAPSGLDTHASVHQAERQLEELPQARVGPDPGEETDHVQTQPNEDQTPIPGLPSPHVWPWTLPFVGLHPGLWLLLLPATNSSSQREDPESLSSSRTGVKGSHPGQEIKRLPPCGSTRSALDIPLLTWATQPDNDLRLRTTGENKNKCGNNELEALQFTLGDTDSYPL